LRRQFLREYFHLIWDDFEEVHRLAGISHPRVVVDTCGLDPRRTELANLLAERISGLSDGDTAFVCQLPI
jgi:hypothetical protein